MKDGINYVDPQSFNSYLVKIIPDVYELCNLSGNLNYFVHKRSTETTQTIFSRDNGDVCLIKIIKLKQVFFPTIFLLLKHGYEETFHILCIDIDAEAEWNTSPEAYTFYPDRSISCDFSVRTLIEYFNIYEIFDNIFGDKSKEVELIRAIK